MCVFNVSECNAMHVPNGTQFYRGRKHNSKRYGTKSTKWRTSHHRYFSCEIQCPEAGDRKRVQKTIQSGEYSKSMSKNKSIFYNIGIYHSFILIWLIEIRTKCLKQEV